MKEITIDIEKVAELACIAEGQLVLADQRFAHAFHANLIPLLYCGTRPR